MSNKDITLDLLVGLHKLTGVDMLVEESDDKDSDGNANVINIQPTATRNHGKNVAVVNFSLYLADLCSRNEPEPSLRKIPLKLFNAAENTCIVHLGMHFPMFCHPV